MLLFFRCLILFIAMLRRKITSRLLEWKNAPTRLPLLVEGARQVGKTTAVLDFAEKNYSTVYNLNFFRDPSLASIFEGSLDPSAILTKLSVAFPEIRRTDGSTLLFLDEIQHCPNGRTALKFLASDPRFDVIASGSLLGIRHPEEVSFPVGYIQRIELQPLDFEEFLWAMGIGEETLGYLAGCFEDLKPVEPFIHTSMLSYFSLYMTIGGMPAAVDSYSRFHDYSLVLGIQKDIVEGYRNDAVKYAEGSEKAKILRTFDSITSQLSKDYKKFQYSVIAKGARSNSYGGALLWLRDAGIISFCRNLSLLQLPLAGFAMEDAFKVYMNDTGLLVSMYEQGTAQKIMTGEIGLFKGAFYENIMAQCLRSQGFPLFYFSPSDSLEIDFVIAYESRPCPIEVKSGENKKSKSLNTVLKTEKYGVSNAIRFSRNNIGEAGGILSLPLYMVMFLKPDDRSDAFPSISPEEIKRHIPG